MLSVDPFFKFDRQDEKKMFRTPMCIMYPKQDVTRLQTRKMFVSFLRFQSFLNAIF